MDLNVLKAIANANAAGAVFYVSQAEGMPLVQNSPPLITVDPSQRDPNDAGKVAATLTVDGAKAVTEAGHSDEHTKPMATYAVQSGGLELPKVKRGFGKGGGGGAPVKYPFETMNIGDYFFVANADVAKGDAFKTMGSAVGSANQRFAEPTGQEKTVTRAKRGPDNKAIKGPDGKNMMETVTLPEKRQTKHFVVRAVEAGKTYGAFTAPSDGAVVARLELPTK